MSGLILGEEFLVNTTNSGFGFPSIATLSDGRIVIGLQNGGPGGLGDVDFNGVSAQIVTATGQKSGGEFLLNTQQNDVQASVNVARLAGGGFVATWMTFDETQDGQQSAIKAQVFNGSGQKTGAEFLVNTYAAGGQQSSHATALANGNFVIVWSDNSFPGNDRARIYGSNGSPIGSEFIVNTATQASVANDVTATADGGFVVSWQDGTAALGDTSIAQRFSASGQKLGGEILVNTATAGDQSAAAVSAFADGGFVAVWTSNLNGRQDIKAQLFDPSGHKSGTEFLVNVLDNTYNDVPDVAVLADGSWVAVWQRPSWHYNSQGFVVDDGYAVVAQMFDRSGNRIGNQALIDNGGVNRYGAPSVTTTADGGYAVAWLDDSNSLADPSGGGVKARIYGHNSPPVITSGNGATATVAVAENTTAVMVVTASDLDVNAKLRFSIIDGNDASYFSIDPVTGALVFRYAPDFEATFLHSNSYNLTVQVTDGHDQTTQSIHVNVTDVDESRGTSGNDTLFGSALADTLIGYAGNDLLQAWGGNDTLLGGAGNDTLDGGDGIDTASYADASGSVKVSLLAGWAQNTGVAAGTDKLVSIENLIGSGFADQLTGNSAANRIEGLDGNDRLDGGLGADTLVGGIGDDRYTIDNAGDVVIENAGEGTDSVSASFSYTLAANLEKLTLTGSANLDGTGNALANTLAGNAGDNRLFGLMGKDSLSAGAGNDVLTGGLGADALTGGAGADQFVFDVLETSANKDTIKDFEHGIDHIVISRAAFAAFAGHATGSLLAGELALGTAATTASQHLIYNQASGALYYDDDGSGAHAKIQIATLSSKPLFDAGDVVLL